MTPNLTWPDQLSARLNRSVAAAAGGGQPGHRLRPVAVGFLRAGGAARFDRDVLAVTGVTRDRGLGLNDIMIPSILPIFGHARIRGGER